MRITKLKAITAVATSVGLVFSGANVSMATETHSETDILTGVELIENVTGTDDVLPEGREGETEQTNLPDAWAEYAEVTAGDSTIAFKQPLHEGYEASVSDNGTLSYTAEDSAYDVHLQAIASPDEELLSEGLRSVIEISNATAPREYVYQTDLSDGADLQLQDDGSLIGFNDGEVTAIIPAPWAVDAEGEVVDTSYELRGNDLIQHVNFDSSNAFPIVADPVWFVPLVVAGGRVIGQVAIKAATKAAAKRAAAAKAARTVIKKVSGRITSKAAKRCYKGAAIGGGSSFPVYLQQTGNGSWKARIGNGALTTVSAAAAGCLSANIK